MKPFTSGELEVMQVLWQHGSLKPAEIQARFPRPIQNAALRSVLLVLLEKGHVTRRKEGKAYFYEARTRSQRTLRQTVRRLADIFSGGSAAALIARMIETSELTAAEIEELKRLADQKAGQKGGRDDSPRS